MKRDVTFPGRQAVTILVECNDYFGAMRHELTVQPDWSVLNFHDPNERIAAAISGDRPACQVLVEQVIPAIHNWQKFCQRRGGVPARIVNADRYRLAGWVSFAEPSALCQTSRSRSLEDAMRHLRGLLHWARAYGLDVEEVGAIWSDLVDTGGWCPPFKGRVSAWDTDEISRDDPIRALVDPEPPRDFRTLGYNEQEAKYLWDVGIHPDLVSAVSKPFARRGTLSVDALVKMALCESRTAIPSPAV